MLSHVSSLIFGVILGLTLLVLPGMALLRMCVPARTLGFLCRVAVAPGITIAFCVLLFTWCDLISLKLGPLTSWLLIVSALFILLFVGRARRSWLAMWLVAESRQRMERVLYWKLRRVPTSEWLAAAALVVTLTILLVVRFNSTWGWCVPPGFDTPQHTLIVQLLLDHHGLFKSWAPYNDAETPSVVWRSACAVGPGRPSPRMQRANKDETGSPLISSLQDENPRPKPRGNKLPDIGDQLRSRELTYSVK
jgi:hypothetical protein